MCVHEMDNCSYHPAEVTHAQAAASLVAAMARPERAFVPVQPQEPAHVYPVPSTDALPAWRARDDYVSADPAHRRQLPRLTYPHWAVTTEARVHYDTHVRWSVRNTYGEVTDLGMLPRHYSPAVRATHRW